MARSDRFRDKIIGTLVTVEKKDSSKDHDDHPQDDDGEKVEVVLPLQQDSTAVSSAHPAYMRHKWAVLRALSSKQQPVTSDRVCSEREKASVKAPPKRAIPVPSRQTPAIGIGDHVEVLDGIVKEKQTGYVVLVTRHLLELLLDGGNGRKYVSPDSVRAIGNSPLLAKMNLLGRKEALAPKVKPRQSPTGMVIEIPENWRPGAPEDFGEFKSIASKEVGAYTDRLFATKDSIVELPISDAGRSRSITRTPSDRISSLMEDLTMSPQSQSPPESSLRTSQAMKEMQDNCDRKDSEFIHVPPLQASTSCSSFSDSDHGIPRPRTNTNELDAQAVTDTMIEESTEVEGSYILPLSIGDRVKVLKGPHCRKTGTVVRLAVEVVQVLFDGFNIPSYLAPSMLRILEKDVTCGRPEKRDPLASLPYGYNRSLIYEVLTDELGDK
jgi:hypothetical protein